MAYEYALVDKDGRLREDFDRKSDAIDELISIEREQPDATAGWMLLTYDDAGRQVGEPEWADHLLALATKGLLRFVTVSEGRGLFVAGSPGASSGTGRSTSPWFRRPPKVAKRTRALSEAGMVGAQ